MSTYVCLLLIASSMHPAQLIPYQESCSAPRSIMKPRHLISGVALESRVSEINAGVNSAEYAPGPLVCSPLYIGHVTSNAGPKTDDIKS
ncbi:hypothetical protein BDV06DRAFT_116795 [Aspergillus oleicola]